MAGAIPGRARSVLAAGDGYTVSTTNGLASLAVDPNYPTVDAYTTQTVVSDQSPGVFTIELSEPSPYDTTVSYAMGGTPAAPTGQSLYGGPVIGQVVISAGDTTAQVQVPAPPGGGTVTFWASGADDGAGEPDRILYEPGATAAAVVFTADAARVDGERCHRERRRCGNLYNHGIAPAFVDRSGLGAVYFS